MNRRDTEMTTLHNESVLTMMYGESGISEIITDNNNSRRETQLSKDSYPSTVFSNFQSESVITSMENETILASIRRDTEMTKKEKTETTDEFVKIPIN